jgi:GNAT superfamily N-acetyltransferase
MRLKSKPQVISILRRRINDDSSYDEFRNAWLPEVSDHYHIPTYVINAEKIDDENETISIGLVCSSIEELYKEADRIKDKEAKRSNKLAKVTSSHGPAELYKIRDIDELFDKNFEEFFIRPFMEFDIPTMVEKFAKANWLKSEDLFKKYWNEQEDGERLVWLAFYQGEFAGYTTLKWESSYQPFKNQAIPEIMDLNILPEYRRRGIGSHLLEIAEKAASKRSDIVGIGCGLYEDYGNAQKLYIKSGYTPDGNGITYKYEPIEYGQKVKLDDELTLWCTKNIT